VRLAVRPSACISATPTGRISVKFDIGGFYQTIEKLKNFGKIPQKISGALHKVRIISISGNMFGP
jgi:hypothetical protein